MRKHPILPAILLLFFYCVTAAQESGDYRLFLKSGAFTPAKNITSFTDQYNKRIARSGIQYFTIIQFDKIPAAGQREQLRQAGIELLDYIPNNAYTATVRGSLNTAVLQAANARAIVELAPEQKIAGSLAKGVFPSWAIKSAGTLDVWVHFPASIPAENVLAQLREKNFDIISTIHKNYGILGLRIASTRLKELAAESYIAYVQAAPPADQALNDPGRNDARADVLNASAISGGYDLRGEGVVIGVGDDSDPLRHIDFTNRLIDRTVAVGGGHGLHVMGTAGGAGIIEERYAGFAPKATIVSQYFSGIFANAPGYVQDYNMVVTNNSYGAIVGDCSYSGVYDFYSYYLDRQAMDLPHLQNVFAAGNDGGLACSLYPPGFGTVLGSYQSAKNVIDVGNTFANGTISGTSSKGPVKDGRIKPEICAMGTGVTSTWPVNTYAGNSGTSMASPAVSGGLALLYQRYRQLNGNADPPNALMKALVCNGATDLGNPGPDYSYGFGWLNLIRSADMLNNHHYVIASIGNGNKNAHTITIPANTAQVKVMLYWNDPAASPLAGRTLVNDLDLKVVTPSSATVLPFVLDTAQANVDNPAGRGEDHINNIEQVAIDNPAAGDYTINVSGFTITQNAPQPYVIVYDIIPVSTTLTYPVGGERLLPGETVTINWDAYGDPANTFTLQYSTDNGISWTDINTSIAATARHFIWTVPSISTDQAVVRLLRNGTAMVSTSQVFTILGKPTVTLASTQCEGYIAINWTAVAGATDYEVMLLRGDQMSAVATTSTTSYTFSGLSKDSVYWVTVRARINGQPGIRARAVSRQPNSGNCSGTISDNDLKVDAILSPVSGRQFTSTALTSAATVTARVKNLDNAAVGSFEMKYFVNGTLVSTEPVTIPIGAGAFYTYNFSTKYDFSAPGMYQLQVVVKNTAATDPVAANDTLSVMIKQLVNPPVPLSIGTDFVDDLESAPAGEYKQKLNGLPGLDRYDFVNSTAYGRIRTFVNSGIAFSGNNALTLDADRYVAAGNTDSLTATFNFGAYDTASDDIRLDFLYKNHGQLPNAANKVWIRGSDQLPWIFAYDLYNNQKDPGSYKKTGSIELRNLLAANGQNFSSSFQVRWGQWGLTLAADNDGGAGYTLDDIHLYKVQNDMQMISIDSPIVSSCGLSSATPVKLTVRNSSMTALLNIPVMYRIDGGTWVTESIASLAGNTTMQYQFLTTANLSAYGSHLIEAKVAYPGDSFHDNDTLSVQIVNAPVVATFPYLENFETGNGYWYTGGTASSWEYGTPASVKINRAASGSKAWKTRLSGNYNDLEYSYLYSPCFNVSGMTNPTLSFSVAFDLEDCGNSLCDAAWLEYSTDGKNWNKLGSFGQGFNWYNKNYTGNMLWSIEDDTRWHVATTSLPTGINNLRLRFVVKSDPAVNREGVAIDDIHVYDNVYGIYDGPDLHSPITKNINGGNAWIDFTSGGKLVVSVLPANQNLRLTDAQVYIHTDSVRNYNGQYYHDRNITVKPANNKLSDSATIRFYFLDAETDSLVAATGCSSCTKPSSAYELGVSKYDDPADSVENGSLLDDVLGDWVFISPGQTAKVPFDKGYYAEFKVKNFSEFWLNDGGPGKSHVLPVQVISFTAAKKSTNDVLLEWTSTGELNTDKYEIEVARGNEQYQQNNFSKIGELPAQNGGASNSYSFTDVENNKTGARYYRLKIIDKSGSFIYSVVRPVVFDNGVKWQIYPNPSTGLYYLVYQVNSDEKMQVKVYDIYGRLLQQILPSANGFIQKQSVDLRPSKYAAGLYLFEVSLDGKKQLFKVIKQ